MTALRRNLCVINSTFKSVLLKLSTCLLEKRVSRLTLPNAPISLLKLLNGRFSIHTWQLTKRSKDKNLKSRWRTKKTRSQFNSSKCKSKIHYIAHQWSVLLKSWKEWSCKMLMKRSSKIISITKTLPKSKRLRTTALFSLCGVSRLTEVARSMSLLSAGIPDIRISSLSVMVLMTS